MGKRKEPPEEVETGSLERLAEFTKRILQVPRAELTDDKDDSDGTNPIDEPCPET